MSTREIQRVVNDDGVIRNCLEAHAAKMSVLYYSCVRHSFVPSITSLSEIKAASAACPTRGTGEAETDCHSPGARVSIITSTWSGLDHANCRRLARDSAFFGAFGE